MPTHLQSVHRKLWRSHVIYTPSAPERYKIKSGEGGILAEKEEEREEGRVCVCVRERVHQTLSLAIFQNGWSHFPFLPPISLFLHPLSSFIASLSLSLSLSSLSLSLFPCSIRAWRPSVPVKYNLWCVRPVSGARSGNMLSLNQICISNPSAGVLHCPGAWPFAYRTVRALPGAPLDSCNCARSLQGRRTPDEI